MIAKVHFFQHCTMICAKKMSATPPRTACTDGARGLHDGLARAPSRQNEGTSTARRKHLPQGEMPCGGK